MGLSVSFELASGTVHCYLNMYAVTALAVLYSIQNVPVGARQAGPGALFRGELGYGRMDGGEGIAGQIQAGGRARARPARTRR